jgi:hypothetical protein
MNFMEHKLCLDKVIFKHNQKGRGKGTEEGGGWRNPAYVHMKKA